LSLLQDLLALKQAIPENQDEWEAAHAAQADEFHSRNHLHDQDDAPGAFDHEMTTTELAGSDEFTVEHDSDDMVHILDGERSIRCTMPYHVWLDLCRETVHKHLVKHGEDN
jgi:hypothetical protein